MAESSRMRNPPDPHHRHRFPAEIIAHANWLYHVFSLSLRDVELILAERGVIVSHESIRRWCLKFGQAFADRLRRRRACRKVCQQAGKWVGWRGFQAGLPSGDPTPSKPFRSHFQTLRQAPLNSVLVAMQALDA